MFAPAKAPDVPTSGANPGIGFVRSPRHRLPASECCHTCWDASRLMAFMGGLHRARQMAQAKTQRQYTALSSSVTVQTLKSVEKMYRPTIFVVFFCTSESSGAACVRRGKLLPVSVPLKGRGRMHKVVIEWVGTVRCAHAGGGGIEVRNLPQFTAILPQFFSDASIQFSPEEKSFSLFAVTRHTVCFCVLICPGGVALHFGVLLSTCPPWVNRISPSA